MASDEVLVTLCRRLKASDRTAFEEVFCLLREDLLRYVYAIVGNDEAAHDLVQDVFLALWGLRTSLEPSGSLKSYLYRMARNRALRHLRDERLHTRKKGEIGAGTRETGDSTSVMETKFERDELAGKLRGWIGKLPERQREAFVLSRYHELSHKEIAALMEISPRTVNNHIMRALSELQRRLKSYEAKLQEP